MLCFCSNFVTLLIQYSLIVYPLSMHRWLIQNIHPPMVTDKPQHLYCYPSVAIATDIFAALLTSLYSHNPSYTVPLGYMRYGNWYVEEKWRERLRWAAVVDVYWGSDISLVLVALSISQSPCRLRFGASVSVYCISVCWMYRKRVSYLIKIILNYTQLAALVQSSLTMHPSKRAEPHTHIRMQYTSASLSSLTP